MASLVCRWLKMTETDAPAAAGGGGGSGGPDEPAAASAGGGAGGGGTGGQHARQLDEAFYLRQLAKERFDPHLFATVFTSGGSGAPQWLNGLIEEPGAWLLGGCWPACELSWLMRQIPPSPL